MILMVGGAVISMLGVGGGGGGHSANEQPFEASRIRTVPCHRHRSNYLNHILDWAGKEAEGQFGPGQNDLG